MSPAYPYLSISPHRLLTVEPFDRLDSRPLQYCTVDTDLIHHPWLTHTDAPRPSKGHKSHRPPNRSQQGFPPLRRNGALTPHYFSLPSLIPAYAHYDEVSNRPFGLPRVVHKTDRLAPSPPCANTQNTPPFDLLFLDTSNQSQSCWVLRCQGDIWNPTSIHIQGRGRPHPTSSPCSLPLRTLSTLPSLA